jgi:predicted transcriptional regulator
MERLRQKGYLERSKDASVFRYGPRVATSDVMKGLVRDFVRRTLGGTVTPFVAYLAETDDLSEDEITALRRFVETLPDSPDTEEKQP